MIELNTPRAIIFSLLTAAIGIGGLYVIIAMVGAVEITAIMAISIVLASIGGAGTFSLFVSFSRWLAIWNRNRKEKAEIRRQEKAAAVAEKKRFKEE